MADTQPEQAGLGERAARGAVVLASRALTIQLLSFGAQVVLARLLVPRDYGLVALGTALITVGQRIADTGLGAALIRRDEPPAREDLEALNAVQLAVTSTLAVGTLLVSLVVGSGALLAALMLASLPISVLRSPGTILLERGLSYGPLARVEISETVVYYCWAIVAAVAGWGAYALATALVARVAFGTVLFLWLVPHSAVRPRWSWARVKPIVTFGALFQGIGIMNLVKDQTIIVGTAAVSGLPTLGLWSLAYRVIQIPGLIFDALWRVSYPAMTKLVSSGRDVAPILERTVARVSVAAGLLTAVLIGAGPHMTAVLFGAKWTDATQAIVPAAAGLLIMSPTSVGAAGLLFAAGRASVVFRSAILHSVAALVTAFSLLPLIGVAAVGLSSLAAAIVEVVVLGVAAHRLTSARLVRAQARPILTSAVSAVAGWYVASTLGATFAGVAAGALVAGVLFCALTRVFAPWEFASAWNVTRRALPLDIVARVPGLRGAGG